MIIIYMIYSRISSMRRFLETLINDQHGSMDEVAKKLTKASIFIDRIGDILDTMKICCSISLIFYISHFTFFTVISIYGFISYFFEAHSNYYDLGNSGMIMTWEFYYAPVFFGIFIFSNLIEKEGRKLSRVTMRIIHKQCNIKVNKRIRAINMQLHHRKLQIECGFYKVDWKLLLFFIGEVSSYLLISLQFDFSNHSVTQNN